MNIVLHGATNYGSTNYGDFIYAKEVYEYIRDRLKEQDNVFFYVRQAVVLIVSIVTR